MPHRFFRRGIVEILQLLPLPIVSVRSVLAEIVLILQVLGSRLDLGIDQLGPVSHLADFFEDDGTVYGVDRIFAPGKRTVVLAENGRDGVVVDCPCLKVIDDQLAGVLFISFVQLFLCQAAEAGDRTIVVIRVGRSIAGDVST